MVTRKSWRILLGILLLFVLVQGVFAEETCTFVRMLGSDDGKSSTTAMGVAADASDTVYVTDTGNNRVQHYYPDGSIMNYWDLRDLESGKSGIPYGIAVDSSHDVYITDRENHTVQKLTTRGNMGVWGSEGTGDGQFTHPTGIAVDSSGNVYVADTGNDRIEKFHSTGTFLIKWGSYGATDGVFNAPMDVTVDSSGQVYVADTGNKRIQKFSPDGTFLAQWGSGGTGNGQFSSPTGIAVDSWGNVYVADLTSRIQKFNSVGEFISSCETGGNNHDIAVDPSGTMYALWQSGSQWKIGIYRPAGSLLSKTPTPTIAKRRTKFEIIAPTVPTTSQDFAVRTKITVTQAASLTTAPTATPVISLSPSLTPAMDSNATMAAPAVEETIRKTGTQESILDPITRFFRDLFGGK